MSFPVVLFWAVSGGGRLSQPLLEESGTVVLAEGPAGLSVPPTPRCCVSRGLVVTAFPCVCELAELHWLQSCSLGLSMESGVQKSEQGSAVPVPVRRRGVLRCGSLCVEGWG